MWIAALEFAKISSHTNHVLQWSFSRRFQLQPIRFLYSNEESTLEICKKKKKKMKQERVSVKQCDTKGIQASVIAKKRNFNAWLFSGKTKMFLKITWKWFYSFDRSLLFHRFFLAAAQKKALLFASGKSFAHTWPCGCDSGEFLNLSHMSATHGSAHADQFDARFEATPLKC